MNKAILMLDDGKVFYGQSASVLGTSVGEICFNTGMTGYQEIFTDPSYFGQILVTTNVHIGNYGVHNEDIESSCIKISALICRNFSINFSRPISKKNIEDYFSDNNIVVGSDFDTRAIVKYIRDKGAMNAVLSSDCFDLSKLKLILKSVPSMNGLELASKVSTKQNFCYGSIDSKYKVAVLDLGCKKNIIKCLSERGCYVNVFKINSSFDEIMQWSPDGILISNGPGDPSPLKDTVKLVGDLIKTNIPVFGICLGHQIIALSQGVSTFKMHNGHRGINHPVKNIITGKCEVTSQNHGFSISEKDIKKNKNIITTHVNLNDNTIEGIRLKDKNCFSVQYHPESSPGPNDSRYLFDNFIDLIKKNK